MESIRQRRSLMRGQLLDMIDGGRFHIWAIVYTFQDLCMIRLVLVAKRGHFPSMGPVGWPGGGFNVYLMV